MEWQNQSKLHSSISSGVRNQMHNIYFTISFCMQFHSSMWNFPRRNVNFFSEYLKIGRHCMYRNTQQKWLYKWPMRFQITKVLKELPFNSLRPRRSRRDFADDIFKRIFLKENVRILIKISLKFVPKSPINNIPALVQIMAWRRPGDKPSSEPMMVRLPTHICVTRPQWVNLFGTDTRIFQAD